MISEFEVKKGDKKKCRGTSEEIVRKGNYWRHGKKGTECWRLERYE
jgi:hypothetical protein